MSKKYYWIILDGTYSYICKSGEDPSHRSTGEKFKTFSEAKSELINYFKGYASDYKTALKQARSYKKSEVIDENK